MRLWEDGRSISMLIPAWRSGLEAKLTIEEDESEPKCAVMKISLVAAKESKQLAQPHTSCLGGWQKMNRNHGWLIWVSYITQQWALLGSHWVLHCALQTSSSLGMSSYCHFSKSGFGFLDQLLHVDLFLHVRGTSHHLGGSREQGILLWLTEKVLNWWRAIKLLHPLVWFTGQPVNMQTTHHMLRTEPLGLKSTPCRSSLQVKILLVFISLYQLGGKHASALSFIHCGVQLWQLFPKYTECWWEDILSFSSILPLPSLFLVQKFNIQHLQLPAI